MFIYNSLSGKKEYIKKPWFRALKLFVCGPTVYDIPHIGNLRTFMSFDIIVRYMRARGFKIFYLQNITDIDDKIIAKAEEEKTSWDVISARYEKEFLEYNSLFHITSVDRYAKATDHIKNIILQVHTLIQKKYAYMIDGDGWYFDLSRFPEYGKLANRTTLQAEDGVSRIDSSSEKRNKGDFCLWKFPNKKGEPSWSAPFGNGRPGWHIEDTAITESFFGPQYDIHGGGVDLKFPHHEAEIAQQESASGKKPFVKTWMHVGFLQVNGQKMSKSLNNFISGKEILLKMSPDEFRFLIFQHHYRSPFNFSEDSLSSTKINFKNIVDFISELAFIEKKGNVQSSVDISGALKTFEKNFHAAMEDDFNTPEAVGALHILMNVLSPTLFTISQSSAEKIKKSIILNLRTLGFADMEYSVPVNIIDLVEKRELYRGNKQFTHADVLRKEIETLGYKVEDTPLGPLVKSIK
jgi:cysteinyl-tRNA synthetase